MGGEWLFCDARRNDYIGRNDHKIRTTLSPHVSFSPYSFVTRQKNKPPEAEIRKLRISHSLSLTAFGSPLYTRGAFGADFN